MSRTIAVIGAYGHPNFGDQLLFNILYKWLKEYDNSFRINVPWGNSNDIEWPRDVSVGKGWNDLSFSDLIIFGGGGFLGDAGKPDPNMKYDFRQFSAIDKVGTSLHLPKTLGGGYFGEGQHLRRSTLSFIKYGRVSKYAVKNNIPCCIIGTGLGPVTTRIGRYYVKRVLENAELICLRDKESVAYAKELCPECKPICTADMALSYCKDIKSNKCQTIKKVGLHIGSNISNYINIKEIKNIIDILKQMGIEVFLLFDFRPCNKAGIRCSQVIQNELKNDVTVIRYRGVDALFDTIRSMDMVITTKLHVGIAAYVVGSFPMSVASHIKTRRFYRQVGLEGFCFDLSVAGYHNAIERLRLLAGSAGEMERLLKYQRETISEMAMRNREVLRAFCDECFV